MYIKGYLTFTILLVLIFSGNIPVMKVLFTWGLVMGEGTLHMVLGRHYWGDGTEEINLEMVDGTG